MTLGNRRKRFASWRVLGQKNQDIWNRCGGPLGRVLGIHARWEMLRRGCAAHSMRGDEGEPICVRANLA